MRKGVGIGQQPFDFRVLVSRKSSSWLSSLPVRRRTGAKALRERANPAKAGGIQAYSGEDVESAAKNVAKAGTPAALDGRNWH